MLLPRRHVHFLPPSSIHFLAIFVLCAPLRMPRSSAASPTSKSITIPNRAFYYCNLSSVLFGLSDCPPQTLQNPHEIRFSKPLSFNFILISCALRWQWKETRRTLSPATTAVPTPKHPVCLVFVMSCLLISVLTADEVRSIDYPSQNLPGNLQEGATSVPGV